MAGIGTGREGSVTKTGEPLDSRPVGGAIFRGGCYLSALLFRVPIFAHKLHFASIFLYKLTKNLLLVIGA